MTTLKIPQQGADSDAILAKLSSYRRNDVKWRDGQSFTPVFAALDEAARVAERAFHGFMWDNALDPTLYPSVMRLETEVVAMAAHHLGGDERVVGNFTSGGTESVMLAIKTARDRARTLRPEIDRPQLVLPASAHPCFRKGAHYFGLEVVDVPIDTNTMAADLEAARAAITDRTIMLAASAPSFGLGVVDPIEQFGKLALEHDLMFHVDGCIGGFLLPYFKRIGREVPAFDFRVPGVTSMSMDLHKYAYAPKGASVVLYRDAELRKHQIFTSSGWPGYTLVNPTIQSSRSAGPLAAAWALLHHFGDDGYLAIAQALAAAADDLAAGIADIPELRLLAQPHMTLIPFTSDTVSVFELSDELRRRGWTSYPQLRHENIPATLHVIVVPQNLARIGEFKRVLAESVDAVRSREQTSELAGLATALASADPSNLTDAQIRELLSMGGMAGGGLPDGRAEVYALLDSLPVAFRDRVLTLWFNELCQHQAAE